MSLIEPITVPQVADVPVANDFQARFVRDVHTLLAEGYLRLVPANLAAKNEETISGAIVDKINEWFDHPATPAWTRNYYVKPEIRTKSGKREGKKRPRIDIEVESSEARPRARFAFEAKRFYRSDSVAEYVGASGLGAFVDGMYAAAAPAAGMLGFVQHGSNDSCVERVHEKLDAERASHGLAPHGAVWTQTLLDTRIGITWVSHHRRVAPGPDVDIYHSFLQCCTSVPVPPAPAGVSQQGRLASPSAAVSSSPTQFDLLSWRSPRRPKQR